MDMPSDRDEEIAEDFEIDFNYHGVESYVRAGITVKENFIVYEAALEGEELDTFSALAEAMADAAWRAHNDRGMNRKNWKDQH